jgi:hypothetical protein
VAQPTNWIPLGFEAQTKKPSRWFWGPNHQTKAAGFEAKPGETIATGFEAKPAKTVATGFEAKPPKTVATGFEAKPTKTITVGFEAKPPETVSTGFEAKLLTNRRHQFWGTNWWETIPVVLRPNHWQTVDLGFKAQPRNPRS